MNRQQGHRDGESRIDAASAHGESRSDGRDDVVTAALEPSNRGQEPGLGFKRPRLGGSFVNNEWVQVHHGGSPDDG